MKRRFSCTFTHANFLNASLVMKNSFIVQLLRTLTPEEQPNLRKFLHSPYFNHRQELCRLYDILLNYRKNDYNTLEKEAVFNQLFPDETFNNRRMNHLLSDLTALMERFFAQEEIRQDDFLLRLRSCRALRKRGITQLFERDMDLLEKDCQAAPYRNAAHYLLEYNLLTERYSAEALRSRHAQSRAPQAAEALANFFMLENLRWACTVQAAKATTAPGESYLVPLNEAVLTESLHTGNPALTLLRQSLLTLRDMNDEVTFEQLRVAIDRHIHLLPPAEARDVYMSAINFAIRRHNLGEASYTRAAFDLYNQALEQEVLAENGALAKYTYINIFNLAQLAGNSAWARQFIDEYRDMLPGADRNNIHRYCLAGYYFRQKNYSHVLELLHEVEFTEVFISLDVRKMLIRSYFALEEWLVLASLLDSFRAYLLRHRDLGYHREGYLNLVKYVKKLSRRDHLSPARKRALSKQIRAEKWLTEREWVLEQVEG